MSIFANLVNTCPNKCSSRNTESNKIDVALIINYLANSSEIHLNHTLKCQCTYNLTDTVSMQASRNNLSTPNFNTHISSKAVKISFRANYF